MGTSRHKEFDDLMRRIEVPQDEASGQSAPPEPVSISKQQVREWRVGRLGYPDQPISLFADPQPAGQRPASFIVSLLAHGAVIGLVAFGVLYAPRIRVRPFGPRMMIRQVELDEPDSQMQRSSGGGAYYPNQSEVKTQSAAAKAVQAEMASSQPKLPVRRPAPQTLVQPDINVDKLLQQKIPVPAMLLWSADRPKVKTITPPKPQQLNASSVIPKVDRPNPVAKLSDIAISSTAFSSNRQMPLPSTTTPLVLPGPQQVDKISETSSIQIAQASAANVATVSDLAMKQGVVNLPAVNQVAPGNGGAGTSADGNGNAQHGDKAGNAGNATHGDTNGDKREASGSGGGSSSGKGARTGKGSGTTNGKSAVESAGNGPGFEPGPAPTPISRPKDGQFGVVVVGNSAADDYPQTARFWSDRIVYTVFLHVGLPQTWILQYSVPRNVDATDSGNNKHVLAPWPYYILRPNLDPDEVHADAMIVHGFISASGRFESLQIAFPNVVDRAQTLLKQMAQWQFKPATENGKPTRVEILLIIPQGD